MPAGFTADKRYRPVPSWIAAGWSCRRQNNCPPLTGAVEHVVFAIEKCRVYLNLTAWRLVSYKQIVIKGKRNLLIMPFHVECHDQGHRRIENLGKR